MHDPERCSIGWRADLLQFHMALKWKGEVLSGAILVLAMVETSAGTFVMALLPESAPNLVGYFIKLASEHAYDGTTFHRAVKLGIVQGGDPISKDPAKKALYGTGGLGMLEHEPSAEKN